MTKDTNAAHDAAGTGRASINLWSDVYGTRKENTTVRAALEAVRSGTYRDKVEAIRALPTQDERNDAKRNTLPMWTFGGTFRGRYRRAGWLKDHSGFAIMDFDHMTPEVWTATRERLKQDPFVYALFRSPSGDGLKVLVRIPPEQRKHKAHYRALLQHFSDADPDPKNSDVSRACFVSWDPDLYVNESAEVFTSTVSKITDTVEQAAAPEGGDLEADNAEDLLNDLSPEERAAVLLEAEGKEAVTALLNDILQRVGRVDFRKLARLKAEEGKLQPKHYIVHAIEEVLRVAVHMGGGLCFSGGTAYIYAGGYWRCLDEAQTKNFLGRAAEKMGADLNDARFHRFRDSLFEQLKSAAPAPPPGDPSRILINLENGTLEIEGGKVTLRDPDPADFLRYRLPFPFDPDATAPEFMRFLDRVLPEQASQHIVSEFLGYVFVKDLRLDVTLFLWGPTAQNGKSTLMNIVKRMFGPENVSHYSLQRLCDEQGYTLAMAKDKLLNWSAEASAKAIASDKFKTVSEGSPTEARLPYGRPFLVENGPKLINSCNALPYMDEGDEGVMRRLLIVPFRVRIPDSEKNPRLADTIYETEAPGVLNWILEGMQRLRKHKRFTDSEASRDALAEHRVRVDSVAQFIADEGLRPAERTVPLKDLYGRYTTACTFNGYRSCSIGTFSARLQAAGYRVERRKQGRIVYCEKDPDMSAEL